MKPFPILSTRKYPHGIASIPWEMIAPHEEQAQHNHGGQTLQRLAERGGLSAQEAVAVLKGERSSFVPNPYAGIQLGALVLAWRTFGAGRMEAFDPCI